MTAHHFSALYGAGEGIPRRLKRLWKHGYLDRPEAQRIWRMRRGGGSKPLVYALANRGARALIKLGIDGAGKRDWTERNRDLSPSSSKLPHELAVADVVVAFRRACAARPALRFLSREEPAGRTALAIPSGKPLYPDDTFRAPAHRLLAGAEPFFVEMDRGSEPNTRQRIGGSGEPRAKVSSLSRLCALGAAGRAIRRPKFPRAHDHGGRG